MDFPVTFFAPCAPAVNVNAAMCGIAELHDTKMSDEKFAMPACMVTSVPVRATPGEFVVAVITTVLCQGHRCCQASG